MSEMWNEGWVLEQTMRTKWCSFTLAPNGNRTAAFNRCEDGTPARGTLCITQHCAAWEAKPGSHADRPPAGRCLRNYRGD